MISSFRFCVADISIHTARLPSSVLWPYPVECQIGNESTGQFDEACASLTELYLSNAFRISGPHSGDGRRLHSSKSTTLL